MSPDNNEPYLCREIQIHRNEGLSILSLWLPDDRSTNTMVKEVNALAEIALDQERLLQEEAVRLEKIKRRESAEKQIEEKANGSNSASTNAFKNRNSKTELNQAQEWNALWAKDGEMQFQNDGSLFRIYRFEEPIKLLDKASTYDRDRLARDQELYLKLKEKGAFRKLSQTSVEVEEGLRQLEQSHPHFGNVINMIRNNIIAMGGGIYFPPILLVSDPGLGKTYFCSELAKVTGQASRLHSMDSSVLGSSLSGSDKHWANSSYGLVFELCCLGDSANPIVILDELDKQCGIDREHQRFNALRPLHSLLEPITARSIRDIAVDITFDASKVCWIATANSAVHIPAPIRSRFTEFFIEPPTAGQALQIAKSIAENVHREMDLSDFVCPSQGFYKLIAHLTPREQCKTLKAAYANAIVNDRNQLTVADLSPEILADDIRYGGKSKSNKNLH